MDWWPCGKLKVSLTCEVSQFNGILDHFDMF